MGDAFCGGGSVPFEAAVLGCDVYGADLSPVSALLTWAAIHLIGGGEKIAKEVQDIQKKVYEAVQRQIDEWGIERNDEGWLDEDNGRDESAKGGTPTITYIVSRQRTLIPAGGCLWPLPGLSARRRERSPRLVPDKATKSFRIEIIQGVSAEEMEKAKFEGTWEDGIRCPVDRDGNWLDPHSRQVTPIEELRGRQGLRLWENDDLVPRPDDVLQERLYCIRWVDPETGEKYYRAPTEADLKREARVLRTAQGTLRRSGRRKDTSPAEKSNQGQKQHVSIRERGWTHWHHLYNPRQLLTIGLFQEVSHKEKTNPVQGAGLLLGIGRLADWCSRLCQMGPQHRQ